MDEPFQRWLAAQQRAGTPMAQALRGPVEEEVLARLRASVSEIPADVVALHTIADGVDVTRWDTMAVVPPRLAPDAPEFVDLAGARARAVQMRSAAVAVSRTMGDDPDELWPPHLGLAYPTWPDECIAVDTESSPGTLWLVRAQEAVIRELDGGLGWLFDRAVERFERLGCVWDDELRILRFDEDLADQLPLFPD